MKSILFILSALLLTSCATKMAAQDDSQIGQELIGEWQLDMSPQNPDDENFAKMIVREVSDGSFTGIFYRDGVRIREGRLNQQTGTLYGALVSGDNSGVYNTAFYLKDGKLYGSTHAIGRGFLSVWVGEKMKR